MTLTRDFRHTVAERAAHDVQFAAALLDEAVTLLLSGDAAVATNKPSKSLHRMLSPKGNPNMDNLAAIFSAIKAQLPGAPGPGQPHPI